MCDSKQWVDQLGVVEDKTTTAKSIQDRCCVIKTDTDRTPISTVVEKIMRLTRNVFLPKLRKLLDSNGHIRSGQQREDVREAIRLFYFAYVKMPRAKKSLNNDDSEGDEHTEHVEKAMGHPTMGYPMTLSRMLITTQSSSKPPTTDSTLQRCMSSSTKTLRLLAGKQCLPPSKSG
jgi:hypothetical protein